MDTTIAAIHELTEDERRALLWLRDKNSAQRNIRNHPDGSREVVDELDLSGGQAALVRLLSDCTKPINERIRWALAEALDHFGGSALQLKKRARRSAGRPKKDSIADDVRRAFDVLIIPDEIDCEARKKRVPAAGEKPKNLPREEIISRIGNKHGVGRTGLYETLKAANKLKNKEK
jgi:hypothetical protein